MDEKTGEYWMRFINGQWYCQWYELTGDTGFYFEAYREFFDDAMLDCRNNVYNIQGRKCVFEDRPLFEEMQEKK